MKEQQAQKETEIQGLKEKLDASEIAGKQKDSEISTLKEQQAQKEAKIKELKEQQAQKDTEIQGLKEQQQQREAEINALKGQVQELTESLDKTTKEKDEITEFFTVGRVDSSPNPITPSSLNPFQYPHSTPLLECNLASCFCQPFVHSIPFSK